MRCQRMIFLCKTMTSEKKHIYDVLNAEKTVDSTGKIHIPKRFRQKLQIEAGSLVLVSYVEGWEEIRIRKIHQKKRGG